MTSRVPPDIPALVTGASSGIGEEFARRLAARGHHLTLVARRGELLEKLASELSAAHSVNAETLVADLETARGREAVARVLRSRAPWLLVNNAGYGSRGRLAELDPSREQAEVQVNVVAVQQLSLAALRGLITERRGGIINVASTAAFQPLPYMATYGATKAFILHFTEGLAYELRGTGVRAMALCPGPVATDFHTVAGTGDYERLSRPMSMNAQRCVADALKAFDRGAAVCIPGLLNHALSEGPRLAPRSIVRLVTGRIFQPPG
ncbi:MAG TPA: SDR family oxidoreductase [Candidatus Dormibacteraeota bacterium]